MLSMAIGVSGLLSGVTALATGAGSESAKYVVVLDPGHGGTESGTSAVHDGKVYREEEINWRIANVRMEADILMAERVTIMVLWQRVWNRISRV